jgi:hypothetical protein
LKLKNTSAGLILRLKKDVLMNNGKDLVGTEDYLNRLELTFHQFYI